MSLALTESQAMIRKAARDFFASECPPTLVKAMERDERGYPPRLWQQMAEMGWLGIVVPSAYGGQEATFSDLLILLQEMGRAAVPSPFFSTAVLGGQLILNAATEAQKEELLPKLCRGELLLGVAIGEPGVDDELDCVGTTAERVDGTYRLTGVKLFVADAHVADVLICLASTERAAGRAQALTAFLVDPASTGVTLAPLHTTLQDRQFEIRLDDVRVPEDRVLGRPGEARAALEDAVMRAAVGLCAEMVGAAERLLEMTVAHAKTRHQFGRPLGSFQAIQHHCANLATYVETAELVTHRAGWLIDQGQPFARAAAQAKAWTNEACKRAAALAHQVHGGLGFTPEYDLYLYSRRVTTWAYLLGDTRWAHERIARAMGM
jgi:alkylation response protein AidB-like acyl-CoA dehydrogenase